MAQRNKGPSAPQFYVYIAYIVFPLRTYDNFRPLDFCWTVYKKNCISSHAGSRKRQIQCGARVTPNLWVLGIELAACHVSGA